MKLNNESLSVKPRIRFDRKGDEHGMDALALPKTRFSSSYSTSVGKRDSRPPATPAGIDNSTLANICHLKDAGDWKVTHVAFEGREYTDPEGKRLSAV